MKTKRIASLGLGLLVAANTQAAALGPGDLFISEFMANPNAVSDRNGEWFEIVNLTNTDINLNGLVLSDSGLDSHTVSSSDPLIIEAGRYFIFGRNNDVSINGGVEVDYEYSGFNLTNLSDEMHLSYETVEVASLAYTETAAGRSTEFVNGSYQFTPAGYSYGDGDWGTPGIANSTPGDFPSPVPLPAAFWLFATALLGIMGIKRNSRKVDNYCKNRLT